MNRHLLSLAALHAAAPGAIDVVFGPDGEFEGAPSWSPPLWYRGQWYAVRAWGPSGVILREWGCATETKEIPLEEVYLDLRIPSVAARLAGLCGRVALGNTWVAPAQLYEFGAHFYLAVQRFGQMAWLKTGGQVAGVLLPEANAIYRGEPYPDAASFLAALTLALAPRIAALRSTT